MTRDEVCAVFSRNLNRLMAEHGLKQADIVSRLDASKAQVSDWCAGKNIPRSNYLSALTELFNCNLSDLTGERAQRIFDNMLPLPQMKRVPLVGSIACGTPTLAEQNIECNVDMPEHIKADFALRCKGDSMINARIYDGDIVYIRQQEEAEHGEIAAVLIDDAATLKRVYLYDDHISLEAENPQYRPMVYWGNEMNNVRILGKAIAFTSAVR